MGHHPPGSRPVQRNCRPHGERAGDGQTGGHRQYESRVRSRDQHPRRRERMESEERRGRHERHRHEEQSGIRAPARRDADRPAEHRSDRGRPENEPEMRWLVIPVRVGGGCREQHRETHDRRRQCDRQRDHRGSRHHIRGRRHTAKCMEPSSHACVDHDLVAILRRHHGGCARCGRGAWILVGHLLGERAGIG